MLFTATIGLTTGFTVTFGSSLLMVDVAAATLVMWGVILATTLLRTGFSAFLAMGFCFLGTAFFAAGFAAFFAAGFLTTAFFAGFAAFLSGFDDFVAALAGFLDGFAFLLLLAMPSLFCV
jgi:hypothetical protein